MEYKGYVGSVEFSEEDGIFFGKVMGIRSLISYEGTDARSLVEDFHGAVDDYLQLCEGQGKAPEKAYKGSFNIRIAPETHKQLVIHATECQMSLNEYVRETFSGFLLLLAMHQLAFTMLVVEWGAPFSICTTTMSLPHFLVSSASNPALKEVKVPKPTPELKNS